MKTKIQALIRRVMALYPLRALHLLRAQCLPMIMPVAVKLSLLFFLISTGSESRAEILLHRAVEPARMGLDISISGEILTLYIALKEESLSILTKKVDSALLFGQLKRMSHFALPAPAARCRVTDQNVHQEPDQIKGYQTFHCERPEQLKFIEVKLYEVLPDLKAIDVWLTTENWQNKAVVRPEKRVVIIKPGILK